MYESPVKIVLDQLKTEQENHIFNFIQGIGVSVDKEELLKALQYDRDQYQKGYAEGYLYGVRKLIERLKQECLMDSGWEVLQSGTIDNLLREMEENQGEMRSIEV